MGNITGKDIHDDPVRVILSTDEEDINNQTDQQHSLKRKYKSNKKRKAVKPPMISRSRTKTKESDEASLHEQRCANDSFSKSTQTTQQFTVPTDSDSKQDSTNPKKNGQTAKHNPFKQISINNQSDNSLKNDHTRLAVYRRSNFCYFTKVR